MSISRGHIDKLVAHAMARDHDAINTQIITLQSLADLYRG